MYTIYQLCSNNQHKHYGFMLCQSHYNQFLTNTALSFQCMQPSMRILTITGEVAEWGTFPIIAHSTLVNKGEVLCSDTTVVEAIQAHGGTQEQIKHMWRLTIDMLWSLACTKGVIQVYTLTANARLFAVYRLVCRNFSRIMRFCSRALDERLRYRDQGKDGTEILIYYLPILTFRFL